MKIKDKIKRLVAIVAMCASLVVMNGVSVMAVMSDSYTIYLPLECKLVVGSKNVYRTKNYSYVITFPQSVYPATEGVEDKYTKCKAQWFAYDGETAVTSRMILTENVKKEIPIKEGYLNSNYLVLKFSGTSANHDAKLTYSFDPK